MIVFHGSDYEFETLRICPEHTYLETLRLGRGPGIYFTDLVSEAYAYGTYVYEIEIPDDVVVSCCDWKWRQQYYGSFIKYMEGKSGIPVDDLVRRECAERYSCEGLGRTALLRKLLEELVMNDVNVFGDALLIEISGYFPDELDDIWQEADRHAVEFDRENYHAAYWFERTRDEHKGVILKLVDGIRLLSRTRLSAGICTDLRTGAEHDLDAELGAWFAAAYPVLSDPDAGGPRKQQLIRDATRLIQLRYPWRWKKILAFLGRISDGRVKRDAEKRFYSLLGAVRR